MCARTPAGIELPRIVDLKWRLDLVVASKDGGKVGAPVYIVDLQLRHPGTGAAFVETFTCSPPELEELRSRVRAALQVAGALAAAAPA